jgi:hypothetical protein
MKNTITEIKSKEINEVSGGNGGLAACVLGIGYITIGVVSYFYGKYKRAAFDARQRRTN